MADKISIQYRQRHQLDIDKWDNAISKAGNGLIYGYSFYLDAMAGEWDALVTEDYSRVMPLPYRKKWGFAYLYQPFLTAQLGLFGNGLSASTLASFLGAIPKHFRYWDFSLNHHNLFDLDGFTLQQRMNYVLPLKPDYSELYKNYRENIKRNIRKSREYGCTLSYTIAPEAIIELAKRQAPEITEAEWKSFLTLSQQLQKKGKAKIYGMLSKGGDLLASAVFFFSHNRAYYILVGNHPNGRTLGASHALIDAFIKDHAGQNLLLDFEGSDIRNLAFFYSSFGARAEAYAAIRENRLPWWAEWLKR
jgi:hypothetical protein